MKKVLLVGGSGFFGTYIKSHFVNSVELDYTYAHSFDGNGIRYRAGQDFLQEVLIKKYDLIINNINPESLTYSEALDCILDIVSYCKLHHIKLLHISSVSALNENRHANSYNLKKAIAEDVIITEMLSSDYCVLRFTQLFDAKGLSKKSQAGLYYLLDSIKHNKQITIFKNHKNCYRNYTPVELAIEFIVKSIDSGLCGVHNAHLDSFTLSFEELISNLASFNEKYNSKEQVIVGEKIGLVYHIGNQSSSLIEPNTIKINLNASLKEAYNLV